MTPAPTAPAKRQRYRLPGISHEGIAQLSLLETALWPLQRGQRSSPTFTTQYGYSTAVGRKTAKVTVRAAMGLQMPDELVLWGLLGATLARPDPEPNLLATPAWMLKHLGLDLGGSQYTELKDSLIRLAVTSYQNTAFYNPESKEHEHATFQFFSLLLPTVGGVGECVDNDRTWRIEWNPAFYRFCRAPGGTLLFDLDVYRELTPAARRLFLKLKDRFWRSKRAFFNIDDLTINGLGFAADRPLRKRKADLIGCLEQLLDRGVVELGRGQHKAADLIFKRGVGSYVVGCFEGPYFRRPPKPSRQSLEMENDPLYQPLRKIGVDGPAIKRLFTHHRSRLQLWIRITEAAMHEHPRGFNGFRVSPAAFLIDSVQKQRTPPDWWHAHEKMQETKRYRAEAAASAADDIERQSVYEAARKAALQAYLQTPEGRAKYEAAYTPLFTLAQVTDPTRPHEAAREAARARIDKYDLPFPTRREWEAENTRKERTAQ